MYTRAGQMSEYGQQIAPPILHPSIYSNRRPSIVDPYVASPFDKCIDFAILPEPPNTTKKSRDYLPYHLSLLLHSRNFLIVLCIFFIVPVIELVIGLVHLNKCTANSNIPIYLIVTGACGIVAVGLAIFIGTLFVCCSRRRSFTGSLLIGCFILFMFLLVILITFFVFIWLIIGSVWVFGARNSVNYDDVNSLHYCNKVLYEFSFAIIIITYILLCCGCFISCCRGFCNALKNIEA